MNFGLRKQALSSFCIQRTFLRCLKNDVKQNDHGVDIRPDVLKVISICDVSNEKAIRDQSLEGRKFRLSSSYLGTEGLLWPQKDWILFQMSTIF